MTICGIMIGFIEHEAPHLFQQPMSKDGTRFKCSESFVRKYLKNVMGWSERQATQAAQKLPPNHEKVLTEAFLREAMAIHDYNIPAKLRVNTDQTQLMYWQGTKTTWTKCGEKQVPTKGFDDKRAFTLVPSISASGKLLPMQAIYQGQTTGGSCPLPSASQYEKAKMLSLRMLPSKSKMYWSTINTMKALVNDIIAPYMEKQRKELKRGERQRSIWKIDCWSVHRSKEFMTWMKDKHPLIIVIFIPGGCTGVWQPLDVGIQRVMKHSLKRSAHRDIVAETITQLANNTRAEELILDSTIGTLRDRSVSWIVNAIEDISRPELIRKVG